MKSSNVVKTHTQSGYKPTGITPITTRGSLSIPSSSASSTASEPVILSKNTAKPTSDSSAQKSARNKSQTPDDTANKAPDSLKLTTAVTSSTPASEPAASSEWVSQVYGSDDEGGDDYFLTPDFLKNVKTALGQSQGPMSSISTTSRANTAQATVQNHGSSHHGTDRRPVSHNPAHRDFHGHAHRDHRDHRDHKINRDLRDYRDHQGNIGHAHQEFMQHLPPQTSSYKLQQQMNYPGVLPNIQSQLVNPNTQAGGHRAKPHSYFGQGSASASPYTHKEPPPLIRGSALVIDDPKPPHPTPVIANHSPNIAHPSSSKRSPITMKRRPSSDTTAPQAAPPQNTTGNNALAAKSIQPTQPESPGAALVATSKTKTLAHETISTESGNFKKQDSEPSKPVIELLLWRKKSSVTPKTEPDIKHHHVPKQEESAAAAVDKSKESAAPPISVIAAVGNAGKSGSIIVFETTKKDTSRKETNKRESKKKDAAKKESSRKESSKPDQPSIKAEELSNKVNEPSIKVDESANKLDESTIKKDEPSIKAEEPSNKVGTPLNKADGLSNKADETTTIEDVSLNKVDEPSTKKKDKPEKKSDRPIKIEDLTGEADFSKGTKSFRADRHPRSEDITKNRRSHNDERIQDKLSSPTLVTVPVPTFTKQVSSLISEPDTTAHQEPRPESSLPEKNVSSISNFSEDRLRPTANQSYAAIEEPISSETKVFDYSYLSNETIKKFLDEYDTIYRPLLPCPERLPTTPPSSSYVDLSRQNKPKPDASATINSFFASPSSSSSTVSSLSSSTSAPFTKLARGSKLYCEDPLSETVQPNSCSEKKAIETQTKEKSNEKTIKNTVGKAIESTPYELISHDVPGSDHPCVHKIPLQPVSQSLLGINLKDQSEPLMISQFAEYSEYLSCVQSYSAASTHSRNTSFSLDARRDYNILFKLSSMKKPIPFSQLNIDDTNSHSSK